MASAAIVPVVLVYPRDASQPAIVLRQNGKGQSQPNADRRNHRQGRTKHAPANAATFIRHAQCDRPQVSSQFRRLRARQLLLQEPGCPAHQRTPHMVALAWLWHKPGVTAPIVGATKIEHLEDALAADRPGVGELFELLADREPATGAAFPGSGLPP